MSEPGGNRHDDFSKHKHVGALKVKVLRPIDPHRTWLKVGLLVIVTLAVVALLVSVVEAEPDTEPPVLVDFSFSPTTVDVTNGPATTTVTFHITDALSGFVNPGRIPAEVRFRSPSSGQFETSGVNPNPISGDLYGGTFEGTLTIDQFAESGTWTLQYIIIQDAVDNKLSLDASQVSALGFPTQLNVTNTALPIPSLSVLGVVVMFLMLASAVVLRCKKAASAGR